jgi:Domain of unknown function (DUF4386)
MNANRRIAISAGVLFILATAASLAGSAVLGSALTGPDFLSKIAMGGNRILVSALLSFVAACTSSAIAIALYPVLRKYNEGLALASVGFRLMEGVFYAVGTMCLLSLFSLSQEFTGTGSQAAAYYQTLGHLLLTVKDLAGFLLGVMAFCIGGGSYYFVFYRSNLIPRWLSAWGLIALALLFSAALITLFDGEPYSVSGGLVYLAFPIALQEMVLAVWLIVKGFNASAIPAPSAAATQADGASGEIFGSRKGSLI